MQSVFWYENVKGTIVAAMLKRLPRCPSKHVLFSFLLIVGALVCCLIPGVARADTVTKVDNLLDHIGGDVYITKEPSAKPGAEQGQYWSEGRWKNVSDVPRDGSSHVMENGWQIYWWKGKWGGCYTVWRYTTGTDTLSENVKAFPGFRFRFNDIGYTNTGERIDWIIEFTQVNAWKWNRHHVGWFTPFEITTNFGIQLAAEAYEGNDKVEPKIPPDRVGVESTYRTRVVKHGTEDLIDPNSEVDTLYWDIDQPADWNEVTKTVNYTSEWRESIWKVSGYKDEALIRKDAIPDWLEVKPDGRGFLSKQNDGTQNAQDSRSEVVMKSAPEFMTKWRGWSCSTSMGFDTVVRAYPKWSDPVKDPPTQVKKRGEIAEFNVKQTFPFVVETNKAKSIVMTDTLDPALDASKAEVKVYKGADDVTSNWTISVSGQTVTATAKNTGHGHVEGEHTFKIRVPVSETADLSSYEQQDDQGNKFWKVPNQASIAINEESKPTNTVHVLVPYEATGSAQLKATKRLDGGQLKDGQFTFRLKDEQGSELDVRTNDADGNVTFRALDYTLADVGKTFTYTITEDGGAESGYTYDTHSETVTVKVEDAGQGKLNVVVTYDADGAAFVNSYAPKVPLAVLKQNSDSHAPLGGAQFTLYLDDGDGSFTSADQPAVTYSDEALQHPIAGSVVTTGLLDGKAIYYGLERGKTYWLKETGAPLGFNLDSQAHEIIVGSDGVISTRDSNGVVAPLSTPDGVSTITIVDVPIPILPGTAGAGITGILLVGAILALGGGGRALYIKKRNGYMYRHNGYYR